MKRIATVALLVFYYLCASAQPRLTEVEVCYPKIFQKAIIQEADVKKFFDEGKFGQTAKSGKHWVAYSDRTDNKIYKNPSTSSPVNGTLNFNEKVRIAKIEKNGFALVYTEPVEGEKFPNISSRAVIRGYVHINNLLLWHTCPANQYNIYNKALLCVNLDKKSTDLGRMYGNPADKSRYEPLETDMNFYFIMKRENNMVLLAQEYSMDGKVSNILKGWINEGSYVPWDQRSCLEPTWDRKDVPELASAKASYKIYHEDDKAMKGKPVVNEPFSTQVKGENRYVYRLAPHLLRFPILETIKTAQNDTIYKCSTFGVSGQSNQRIMSKMEAAPDKVGYTEESLRQLSNIDIALVIDGTKSMEPYFPAVKQAIKDAEKFFEADKFRIRVGLVIYRDYTDGEGNSVEVYPFTDSRSAKLGQILDSGGKYGIRSHSRDKSLEEALYLGIDTALEQLNFNKDHSNLLFLVGDCGNDRNDTRFSRDELVRKMADKKVHFMGFQVRYGTEEAFATFNDQIKYIMRNSLLKKYQELDAATTVQWKQTPKGIELNNSHKSYIFVGAHYQPSRGEVMPASTLTELIGDAILVCKSSITSQQEALRNFGFRGSSFVEGVQLDEEFVKDRLGEEVYEQMKNGHNLMSFQGYTHKKSGSRNVYKPVLFISAPELEALLRQLQPVNAAAADANDRAPYITAMKSLIISLSPGLTEDQINNMDINLVMSMVMGLNETPDALSKYTLTDIGSTKRVSPEEYRSIVTKFSDRYNYLRRISSREYKYTYKVNDLKYYWLPIEYLP